MSRPLAVDEALRALADHLAMERDLGRRRLEALGELSPGQIQQLLRHGEKMHLAQLAWAERELLRAAGLADVH